jgi:hypothetical protein
MHFRFNPEYSSKFKKYYILMLLRLRLGSSKEADAAPTAAIARRS